MNEALWWHVARATGIVAWALSALAVLWGLALSTRLLGKRPAPGWLLDLHRYVGGLTLTFTGVHVAALLLDSYIEFSVFDVLVPFVSEWRPGAVAWGVAAFYLLLAVQITSLLRARVGLKWWRRAHLLSVPLYLTATIHLLMAGSDAGGSALRAAAFASLAAVAFFTLVRLLSPRRSSSARSKRPQAASQRLAPPTGPRPTA